MGEHKRRVVDLSEARIKHAYDLAIEIRDLVNSICAGRGGARSETKYQSLKQDWRAIPHEVRSIAFDRLKAEAKQNDDNSVQQERETGSGLVLPPDWQTR